MIQEIRSYFNTTARAENSDLRPNDKPTTDETPDTIIEDNFFPSNGWNEYRIIRFNHRKVLYL